MKHIAATLFLLSVVTTSLAQTTTKIDTAYYDDNYEIVNKSFATYMRIYEKNDDKTSLKHFKDYFVDGNKLSSEGVYLYFKGPGDSHPTVVGKHKKYNKQGVVILDANHDKDGLLDGEYYEYYDNGLVKVHGFYSHDKLDGRVTAFSEKGWMQQYQFIEGEMNPVYTVTSPEGYTNKVHEVDGKAEIYYEDPTDRQLGYSDGTQYQYYTANGLYVAMSCSSIKEYGKYLQVNVLVSNGSLEPIMISTENIVAGTSVDGKEELKPLEVLSCDEYMQKVKRRQNVASAFNGLAQGLAAANAGYSSSYTNTNYYGTSNTTANAYAYGSGGYAYGHLNSNTTNIGTISTSTREYDGFKAYQAQQIASANIASYDMALLENRNILQAGYLKSNTVQPGETISGYANIKYTKGSLYVSIKIGGASYFFSWK